MTTKEVKAEIIRNFLMKYHDKYSETHNFSDLLQDIDYDVEHSPDEIKMNDFTLSDRHGLAQLAEKFFKARYPNEEWDKLPNERKINLAINIFRQELEEWYNPNSDDDWSNRSANWD